MANCGISGGIGLSCDTKIASSGGLKQLAFLANLADIVSFSYNGNNEISSINFATYKGLYEFTSTKSGASTISDINVNEGGVGFYPHTVVLSLLDITPAQKAVLQDLANSEVVAIVETSAGRFELFGWPLGLQIESAPRNSGNTPEESTARVVTLVGNQSLMEKIVSIPDSDTGNSDADSTRAALQSYVV